MRHRRLCAPTQRTGRTVSKYRLSRSGYPWAVNVQLGRCRAGYLWLAGQHTQELFYARIKDLEEPVKATGGELLRRLRHLTTSGQPYFMHEGAGVDHAVDSYFSPYDGLIVESVRVANDKIWDLEISVRQFQILKKQRRHLSC